MAQIIELLGDFPLELKMGGRYSQDLFSQTGPYTLYAIPALCYLFMACALNRYPTLDSHVETVAAQACHDREVPILRTGWK